MFLSLSRGINTCAFVSRNRNGTSKSSFQLKKQKNSLSRIKLPVDARHLSASENSPQNSHHICYIYSLHGFKKNIWLTVIATGCRKTIIDTPGGQKKPAVCGNPGF